MIRRSFLATVVVCFGSSGACLAQDAAWATAMFDHMSRDFGVVARGAKVEHRFTFENIYVEDMRIASVHSSCNCTTITFPKVPIKTYEKAEIVASIDTRKFWGRREATIRVNFAEPFRGEVQLHVYSYIRSDVVCEPGEVSFGSVEQGNETSRKVRVSYAGRSDWQILSVESNRPDLTATVTEVSRSAGQVAYELAATLHDNAPVGYIKDHLVLVTNDRSANAARVPIAVEGVIASAVSVTPSPLPLGILQAGQEVTRNLVVRAKKPFHVLKIDGPDDRFHFVQPETAAPLQLVSVTFSAGEKAGKVAGTIHIQTDLKDSPTLDVEVDGMVLADQD